MPVLMKNTPATITSRTMPSLMATNTKFICEEILIPIQMTAVRISTIAAATRLCPSSWAKEGIVIPA